MIGDKIRQIEQFYNGMYEDGTTMDFDVTKSGKTYTLIQTIYPTEGDPVNLIYEYDKLSHVIVHIYHADKNFYKVNDRNVINDSLNSADKSTLKFGLEALANEERDLICKHPGINGRRFPSTWH